MTTFKLSTDFLSISREFFQVHKLMDQSSHNLSKCFFSKGNSQASSFSFKPNYFTITMPKPYDAHRTKNYNYDFVSVINPPNGDNFVQKELELDFWFYDMLEMEYSYGFNSMEKDNEVKGNGNSYTTEFRQYDPRLGRWLSLDPLFQNFPWQSPYAAFDNNPIYYNDPLGAASEVTASNKNEGDKATDGKNPEVNEVVVRPSRRQMLKIGLNNKIKAIKETFNKVTNFITKTIPNAIRKFDAWFQTDGLYLVTLGRIGSPTKTRSKYPGREIIIDGLFPALGGLKSSDIKRFFDRVKSLDDAISKTQDAFDNHNGPDPGIKDGYYEPSKVPQSNKIHWRMKKSRYGSNTGQRFDASPKEMINGDTLGGNSDINLYPGNKGHIKD